MSHNLWPVGSWLSAALDDPSVCAEMKRDIREWFDGYGHVRALRQEPSVEEIEALIRRHVSGSVIHFEGRSMPGLGVTGADKAAQAISALYRGKP